MMIIHAQVIYDYAMTRLFVAGFFGFPTWYEYLPENVDGTPKIDNITDFWLIAAAGLDMIIRLAGILAVVYFIYSGFSMIISQGNPEKIAKARTSMLQATAGLIIVVLSAGLVSLVVGVFD